MAGKAWLLVVTMLAAGCIAADVSPASTDVPAAAPLWWDLPVAGGPAASVTSFWWTVPEGAVVPWSWNDEFGEDQSVVPLEATLVLPEGVAPTRWAVFSFREGDDGLTLAHATFRAPEESRFRVFLQDRPRDPEPVEAEPFFLRAAWGDIEAGDRIGLVVALETPEPVQARFAFRTLEEDFDGRDDPAPDVAAFLASLEGSAATLAPAAVAEGLHVAMHVEFSGFLFLPPYEYRMTMGDVVVEESRRVDARPAAQSGRVSASSTFDAASGWGGAMGLAAFATATGSWSVAADVRGSAASGGGVLLPVQHATGPLVGAPWFVVLGDGEGAHAASVEVEAASVDTDRLLAYISVGLGAPLSTLLGAEGARLAYVGDGAVGPRAWTEGGTVRLQVGGAVLDVGQPRPRSG